MNQLTINLVTYNGADYLPLLFDSLKKQTNTTCILNVLDNNSTDNTVELLKSELNNLSVQSNLIVNKENIGFSAGHNLLYSKVKTEYFVVLNQDIKLDDDCLLKLVKFLENDKQVGSVSPRLMNWQEPDQIDSLGLKILRNRRVIEIGANKSYEQYGLDNNLVDSLEVFGVSATCAVFRTQAVKGVLYDKQYLFDPLYFAYKEDVDLAYRLQSAGFSSYTVLDAVAWHDRTSKAGNDLSDQEAVKNKQKQNSMIKYYSYKNHLATIYKNEYWQNFLFDFLWIKWYEAKKFWYFLLFDRQVLKSWFDLWKNRADLKAKRQSNKAQRKKKWDEIREWFK